MGFDIVKWSKCVYIQNVSQNHLMNRCNTPNFKAIPLAKYSYLHEKGKEVTVYQLESRDVGYLKYLRDNITDFYEKFEISDESTQQVSREAFEAGAKILGEKGEDKAKVLMSFYNGEPSSILIGNVLKVDKKGKLHYSSRKNHAARETELDWLTAWNKKIPGEGTVTVYEYFNTLLKDGFKNVYVRSEIPEKSSATKFYGKMGFKPVTGKQRKLQTKTDNEYVIGNYDDAEDMIVPMKASRGDIKRVLDVKKDEVLRSEINNKKSVRFDLCI